MKKIFSILVAVALIFQISAQNEEIAKHQKTIQSSAADTLKLFAFSELNWIFSTIDVQKSLNYGFSEMKLAQKIKNEKWLSQSYNDIAISYFKMGKLDSALQYNTRALKLRIAMNDGALIASSQSKIGVVLSDLGQYKKALESHFNALQYFEKNNANYHAMTLNNISLVYEKLKNQDKAINYAEKAVEAHLKAGDEYSAALCYGNLGNAYKKKNNIPKSDEYLEKALVIFKKVGDKNSEAGILNGLAVNLRTKHQDQQALDYYKKAYAISEQMGDAVGVNLYGHNISCVLRDLGKYREAEKYSLAGLKNTGKLNSAQLLLSYRQLATIYGHLHEGKKAETFLNKYTELKDSIFSEKSASQIAELEVKYQTEKTLRELAQEKVHVAQKEKINSQNQLKLESRKKWMLGAFSLAFLILIIGLGILRSQRIKRANDKREFELNKQLETVVLEKGFADEKIRIARELHDNIGSHLTFMISSLDNLSYANDPAMRLEKIQDLSNFGRLTMKDLRDTIWAMNHDGGTMEQLITRISELRSVLPNTLEVEIKNEVDLEKEVNGLQLLNCFRIVQEFIQNAIKYADASLITISISDKSTDFDFKISDNGNGFEISKISLGNGILNMQRRCEDLGGSFEIKSGATGTTIECLIPWKNVLAGS